MSNNKISVLDCTLRDGGYYTNWDFPEEIIDAYFKAINDLPIDYVEIGYISKEQPNYHGAFFYLPRTVLENCRSKCDRKFSIMVNEKDVSSADIPELLHRAKGFVDLVRLAVKPENINSSINCGKELKKMGFKVALNLMYASEWNQSFPNRKSLDEINNAFDFFYIVDSYGALFPEDVQSVVKYLKDNLNIPIGFHGHNNLELAMANSLSALESGIDLIDSTVIGMGRGAGNLRTELILSVLQKRYGINLDFDVLYNITEKFQDLKQTYGWGTNLPFMVSGLYSLPQDAVMSKVKKRYFSLNEYSNVGKSDFENSKNFKLNKKYKYALLVGGGESVYTHKAAIIEYLNQNPEVLVIYASSKNVGELIGIDNHQIHFLAGNEGKRLELELENHSNNSNRTLLLAPEFFSTLNYLPKKCSDQIFYLKNEDFQQKYKRSVTALILQFCLSNNVSSIYITGYDGYGISMNKAELELFEENQKIFDDFNNNLTLKSITPTEYRLESKSIYTLI
ncbi:aldolase catalytic domain-containing protein [Christiangramia salexigens]|uniref:Pyruvate carboxyltransferase domain-containing protein n=1 Tax=Christiangramia salexigens TaxID=1913577 RepID=A0A1L3J2D5_9FLAO|nr:aldolase catalytic domain-containing protein [Christiangramia salexigens]APG59285.1 hypothetical protein LPB144_02155 [Christiangramia salexigens]